MSAYPTFPTAEAASIMGFLCFHFSVRNGKRWDTQKRNTDIKRLFYPPSAEVYCFMQHTMEVSTSRRALGGDSSLVRCEATIESPRGSGDFLAGRKLTAVLAKWKLELVSIGSACADKLRIF